MDQQECSEMSCEVCDGKNIAFLWARDSTTDGRWVINEALNTKQKGAGKRRECCCGKN